MHATGDVWCASYVAAKGQRSKPIEGAISGDSYASSRVEGIFDARGVALSRSLALAA
jgi:hypothetical protein